MSTFYFCLSVNGALYLTVHTSLYILDHKYSDCIGKQEIYGVLRCLTAFARLKNTFCRNEVVSMHINKEKLTINSLTP